MDVARSESLAGAVRDALRLVIDPELGDNIVDLGLIYFVAVDERGAAHIVMTTTTPGCPAAGYLKEGARNRAAAVPGIASADVAITYDPPWSPERMTPAARQRLGMAEKGRASTRPGSV